MCVIVLLLFMLNNEVLLGKADGDGDGDDRRSQYCTVHGMLFRGRQAKLLEYEKNHFLR